MLGGASLWMAGVVLSAAAACTGSKFTTPDPAAGGSAGSEAPGGKMGGGDAGAGEVSGAGGTGQSGAGPSEEAGGANPNHDPLESGGAGGESGRVDFDCTAEHGVRFEGHCYVDLTVQSVHQVDAAAACEAFALRTGRTGELLRLDSPEEQAFVIEQFLTETTDAWLGLTCSSKTHADSNECYCQSCDDAQLLEKRAAWTWPDGSSSGFGWIGKNPDGEGRCSALAFNNSNDRWGWVDRVCLSTSHQIEPYPLHGYRVLCEME